VTSVAVALLTLIRVSNSSSPLIASCKCLGVIRFTCGQTRRRVNACFQEPSIALCAG
jgi:hypothetical protein